MQEKVLEVVDNRIKKRFLISVLIGILGEVAVAIYITEIYPALNWQLLIGSLLLIIGVLSIFNFFSIKKTTFKDKTLLFYAIIFNPCLVSIFAGVTALTIQNPQLQYIYIFSGISMILSLIIGFGTLIVAVMKRRKKEGGQT